MAAHRLHACNEQEQLILWDELLKAGVHKETSLSNADREQLRGLQAAIDPATGGRLTNTGAHWITWCQCTVTDIQPASETGHPVKILRKSPNGIKLQTWETLKGTNQVVRFTVSHLAFIISHADVVLPSNLGAGGGSVSHLCDRRGCITGSHCEFVPHSSNMERQRCSGVLLLIGNECVLQEVRCPHDTTPDFSGSCRKVRLILLNNNILRK